MKNANKVWRCVTIKVSKKTAVAIRMATDTLYPAILPDCSSRNQGHVKIVRSLTIENRLVKFTIDFDLQKSLTLQLPQSAEPRPDHAYKLRPALCTPDTELAGSFIRAYVTDTYTTDGDPPACKVLTCSGDRTMVEPDGPGSEANFGLSDRDGTIPL